jgi:chromosome partitioning protein
MMGDLISVIRDAGAKMQQDFLRYVVTRHDPFDQSQVRVVTMLRHLFAEDVLTATAIASTAIETAGLAKRTLYELEPGNISAATAKRARESVDAVNEQILELIAQAWGRT